MEIVSIDNDALSKLDSHGSEALGCETVCATVEEVPLASIFPLGYTDDLLESTASTPLDPLE